MMGPQQAIKTCVAKSLQFQGRASRAGYGVYACIRCSLAATFLILSSSMTSAAELAHPDSSAFEACANDMTRSWEDTASSLNNIGWILVDGYPVELAELERAKKTLIGLECCNEEVEITTEGFIVAEAQAIQIGENGGTIEFFVSQWPEDIRIWESPDRLGYVALYDTEAEWICEIFLRTIPTQLPAFLAADHGLRFEVSGNDIVRSAYDFSGPAEKLPFFELFSFLPSPTLYFADYTIADKDALSALSGSEFPLAMTAEIGAAYRY